MLPSVSDNECNQKCPGDPSQFCGGRGRGTAYEVTSFVPPVLTFFLEPARNRGSLFFSGRLKRWASGRYVYRTVIINNRLSGDAEQFLRETCSINPGPKVFIGHGELLLRNWPGNAVMIITGDEPGDWGLVRNNKYYGLHGPGGMFASNESHPLRHILMPPHARPWYRQYYDSRQVAAFGDDARYFPLGSRPEFPDVDPGTYKAAPDRTFVYLFAVAGTDPSRLRAYESLKADRVVPRERGYLHFSPAWHPNTNNNDYLPPEEYARIMQDSVFVLCPKGHSIDQFRIYEALEAGAIPVMENKDGYLAGKLPPEYLASPMLFVPTWDEAPTAMMQIVADPDALARRQRDMVAWYDAFMRDIVDSLERAADERAARPDPLAEENCRPYRVKGS